MNRPSLNPDTMNQFAALDDAGNTTRHIATELGVTTRTIQRWRQATGRPRRLEPKPPHTSTDREQARRLIEDGCSITETARTIGVSWVTIRAWFPEARAWSKREAGLYRQMLYGFEGRADVRPSAVREGA